MLVDTLQDGTELHWLTLGEDLAPHRQPFAEAYPRIFAGAPYHEQFTSEEAGEIFDRLTSIFGHITLLAYQGGAVVGFGIAIPLSADEKIGRKLSGLVPVKHTMYLVELGVAPEAQGRKLGKRLVRERIRRIDRDRYSHVVLRVAENRTSSVEMYRKLDFHEMGVSMLVSRPRTDGTTRADRRHFMARVLSQVKVDDVG